MLCVDLQLLGLRYRLLPQPDGDYGHLSPDLTWNGMIGQLIDRVGSHLFRARPSVAFDLASDTVRRSVGRSSVRRAITPSTILPVVPVSYTHLTLPTILRV